MRLWRTRELGWAAVGMLVVTAVSAAPASAAKPVAGGHYQFGSVWSNNHFDLKVAKDRKSLRIPWLQVKTRCSNGREQHALSIMGKRSTRVSPTGEFSIHLVQPRGMLDAFTVSEEFWVSGKFIRKGNAAKVRFQAKLVGEAGTVCETDRTVIAKRRRGR